jgi:hypothetical protein
MIVTAMLTAAASLSQCVDRVPLIAVAGFQHFNSRLIRIAQYAFRSSLAVWHLSLS